MERFKPYSIRTLLKKTKMFTKPLTRALRYTNQILLSSNRLELSP